MKKLLILFLFCMILLSVNISAADNYVLRGQVLDEHGQVFSYVSVGIVGLNRGGVTNEDGKFNIAVPDNKQYNIRISMVGYSKIEDSISSGQYKVYNLKVDPFLMDEVIVKGKYQEPEESTEPDIMMQPFFFPSIPYTAQSRAGATGTSGRTWGSSGYKAWEENKDVKNVGNICDKGCNKDTSCETDNPNKNNILFNNPGLKSVCWDTSGFHQDYCEDETHVVEFGCGGATTGTGSVVKNFFLNPMGFITGRATKNAGTCTPIVKECKEGTCNDGECEGLTIEGGNFCPTGLAKAAAGGPINEPCEISVDELVQSYNLVDIKAKDATLNLMLGLYKKYKGTNKLIMIKSETIKLALASEELKKEKTDVELDKLEYLTFDGKNIVVKFYQDHKQNAPFSKSIGFTEVYPAEIELSAETKWVMNLEEDEIISINLVEGYGKVKVKWLYRKIAEQYNIKDMDIYNAALTVYDKDGKKSLYGVAFSDEMIFDKISYPIDGVKLADAAYLNKLNEMDNGYKPDYSYFLSLSEEERNKEWEKIRQQEEEVKKKYHHDFKVNPNYYFYKDFNGIDVSNMELGTINKGEGLNMLYGWLNKQMTEKSLRLIFSENPDVFIPLASSEFIDNLYMLQLGASEAGWGMIPINNPYAKNPSKSHQAFADSIVKLVKEGSIEEVKIPKNSGGYYFYYIKKK